MKTPVHLYLILLTVITVVMAWITDQLDSRPIQIIIVSLAFLSGIAIIVTRKLRGKDSIEEPVKKTNIDFGHREQKSGLTWGGGNIKAANAKRGTKRKFLGK